MGNDALLLKDNVIPLVRKVPSESIRISTESIMTTLFGHDPSSVNIYRACGNFSSVVEFSTKYCLRVFDSSVGFREEYVLSNEEFGLIPAGMKQRITHGTPIIVCVYRPKLLSFPEAHKVKIEYTVDCFFDYKIVPPLVPEAIPPFERFEPLWNVADRWPGVNLKGPDPVLQRSMAMNQPGNMRDISRLDDLRLSPSALGSLKLVIEGPVEKSVNVNKVTIDVLLAAERSTITVAAGEENSVLAKLLGNSVFENFVNFFKYQLAHKSNIKIIPTICSVGTSNTVGANVTEYQNYDVVVFPLSQPGGHKLQALAVAININEGCRGYIENVQHFIGDNDYGVISDENYIRNIFKFKWRIGGFKRSFSLSRPVDLTINHNEATGTLVGHVNLTSLDYAVLELNSDTRQDDFKIGGMSDSKADRIVLPDGKVILPGDDPGLDFSQATSTPWEIATKIELEYTPNSNPETRQFIERMQTDGIRHIARPFMNPNYYTIKVNYVRLEGVSKMFYALANDIQFSLPPINI